MKNDSFNTSNRNCTKLIKTLVKNMKRHKLPKKQKMQTVKGEASQLPAKHRLGQDWGSLQTSVDWSFLQDTGADLCSQAFTYIHRYKYIDLAFAFWRQGSCFPSEHAFQLIGELKIALQSLASCLLHAVLGIETRFHACSTSTLPTEIQPRPKTIFINTFCISEKQR